jgi:hypothetical protein
VLLLELEFQTGKIKRSDGGIDFSSEDEIKACLGA